MDWELERLQREKDEAIHKIERQLEQTQTIENHLMQVRDEYSRVVNLSGQAGYVLDKIDRDFKEKTKLTGGDIVLLFLCTALQCARQYLLTNDMFRLENIGNKTSSTRGDLLMKNTVGKLTPPSWEEELFKSVPYDATKTSTHVSDTGLSGATHRYRTLGHDPVLGWIFGTANIMTNSLTKSDFITTYQVSEMKIVRRYPLGTPAMMQRAINYACDDPILLAAATARQAIHFGSDYFTKQGLPIPFLGTLSPETAHRFMNTNFKNPAHIDMWSITRSAALSGLINKLVAVIHTLFYNESRDGSQSMYEVRTRKILSYSNALATGSNVIVVAFTEDLSKLDIGGMLVTLYRLVSDYKFIHEVKRDFLNDEFYKMVIGDQYDFMGRNQNV